MFSRSIRCDVFLVWKVHVCEHLCIIEVEEVMAVEGTKTRKCVTKRRGHCFSFRIGSFPFVAGSNIWIRQYLFPLVSMQAFS